MLKYKNTKLRRKQTFLVSTIHYMILQLLFLFFLIFKDLGVRVIWNMILIKRRNAKIMNDVKE
jgi:hypothetical protein